MVLTWWKLLIKGLLILIASILAGCVGYRDRSYGVGPYGNQGVIYSRQPYGYPAQGNGYYPPRGYSTYSYPAYYSRHGHDDDGGRGGRHEREHDRD